MFFLIFYHVVLCWAILWRHQTVFGLVMDYTINTIDYIQVISIFMLPILLWMCLEEIVTGGCATTLSNFGTPNGTSKLDICWYNFAIHM